jgi:hypothetical protein
MPTRPLFPSTFSSSQSIVSNVSELSSTGSSPGLCGRMLSYSPSDMNRPRTS